MDCDVFIYYIRSLHGKLNQIQVLREIFLPTVGVNGISVTHSGNFCQFYFVQMQHSTITCSSTSVTHWQYRSLWCALCDSKQITDIEKNTDNDSLNLRGVKFIFCKCNSPSILILA